MAKKTDDKAQIFICRASDQTIIGYGDDAAEATAICDGHRTSGRGHATFMLEDYVEGMIPTEAAETSVGEG